MKLLKLLLLSTLCISTGVMAQTVEIQQSIDTKYIDQTTKDFIYAVSPKTKQADEFWFETEKKFTAVPYEMDQLMAEQSAESTGDTSWSYSEDKYVTDSAFVPVGYHYNYIVGDPETSYQYRYFSYKWNRGQNEWNIEREQVNWYTNQSADSSYSLNYMPGETEPYSGTKYRYPESPSDGADREYFIDNYTKELGWFKYNRLLAYQNELDTDTLTLTYKYDLEAKEFFLQHRYRYYDTEDYYLSENKYFDEEGNIINWHYTFYEYDNGREIYQISKMLNNSATGLAGQDSVHFLYNDDYVEGRRYNWDDSTWVLDRLYRSYQRTIPNPDPNPGENSPANVTLVDSVVTYSFYPDSTDENGNPAIDEPIARNEIDYDEFGNQVEVRNYRLGNGGLVLASRAVYTYELIGETYRQTEYTGYTLDYSTNEMYKSNQSYNLFNEENTNYGFESYSFDVSGDTTYARANYTYYPDDLTTLYIYYDWDYDLQQRYLRDYRLYTRENSESGKYISQNSYYNPNTQSGNRSINTNFDKPAVMNDGPIVASTGDTLSIYVSARNINMSIPQVSVTNIPATATYDENTRRFYWIVDEEDPEPMYYTAENQHGSTTIEVPFSVNYEVEQVGTKTEELATVHEFKLTQNYPNPFNPSTVINYQIPVSGEVSLKVFDMLGREVATLVNGRVSSGTHSVNFDASHLSSGMYIYRIQSGNFSETRKMMLIK